MMHMACMNGHAHIVKWLLRTVRNGDNNNNSENQNNNAALLANNCENASHTAPIHLAAGVGRSLEIVKLLLKDEGHTNARALELLDNENPLCLRFP